MTIDPRLHRIVAAQPYPLLFATISGAHLYGFPSPDSDYDLRGAHVLPLDAVAGLDVRDETVQDTRVIDGLDMDIVSHDVRKFFSLLLKKNGYVLEQLFSPLIVHTTPEHKELKAICNPRHFDTSPGAFGTTSAPHLIRPAATFSPRSGEGHLPNRGGEGGAALSGRRRGDETQSSESQSLLTSSPTDRSGVITKHHSHHYFGFAETQWKLFLKESPRRVKPLLYVYRVLLTGIHLMRTGVIEANLVTLNGEFRLPYIAELIERKTRGENTSLNDADVSFHEAEYQRLRGELQKAHDASHLPELPSDATRAALNDLLVRLRTKGLGE